MDAPFFWGWGLMATAIDVGRSSSTCDGHRAKLFVHRWEGINTLLLQVMCAARALNYLRTKRVD